MSTPTSLHIALLGNPNCGKTALFNLLTGSRQKVANYPGVTVERKEGLLTTPGGRRIRVVDLPGAYSLNAMSIDEEIMRDVVVGTAGSEDRPDLIVCVLDATNLRLGLTLVLEVKPLGLPMIIALNMSDLAAKRGVQVDVPALQRELGLPVVETVAVRRDGARHLLAWLDAMTATSLAPQISPQASDPAAVTATQQEVRRLVHAAVREAKRGPRMDERIDRVVLHPVWGFLVLVATLFFMFQAVFSWAALPMEWIKAAVQNTGALLLDHLPDTILRSLLVDGIIAGAGSVLVFLPQILILFLFILVLEDSGYLPRAAFLLDRLMGVVGLSGRSFIPLLSSFACAVPGIMATRTIGNWRDRLATMMIAPLMTCSARLPVYALIIGAFIPAQSVGDVFNLQGLVLFTLYLAGLLSAMLVAWVLKRSARARSCQPLLLELPSWRWPHLRNLVYGLVERARIFLLRVGNIILALMILLWFLSSFPAPPAGAIGPAIRYSYAGMLGEALAVVFAPIGFNWQISIALVPGMAAREVAVGALGTVYALSATGEDVADQLAPMLAAGWSLPTAFALLAWYVFSPQCLSTLATVRRETNSWRYPLLMACYLFALAYCAAFLTYRIALAVLGGNHA